MYVKYFTDDVHVDYNNNYIYGQCSTNQPQLKHMQCVHKEEIQLLSIFLCMSFYCMEYTVEIFAVIHLQST